MITTTEYIMTLVSDKANKQGDIARTLSEVILTGEMEKVDWKQINDAITERWSLSARERVLTMAWKIVEATQ